MTLEQEYKRISRSLPGRPAGILGPGCYLCRGKEAWQDTVCVGLGRPLDTLVSMARGEETSFSPASLEAPEITMLFTQFSRILNYRARCRGEFG